VKGPQQTRVQGPCYPASEAIYHAMGGKSAGLTPMRIVHEGVPHWYLRWQPLGPKHPEETYYIDPTSTQFETPVPYAEGRGMGFQTREPSKRARRLMA
jgi:hypothetical protein